jgi:hypothetical protein
VNAASVMLTPLGGTAMKHFKGVSLFGTVVVVLTRDGIVISSFVEVSSGLVNQVQRDG